MFNNRNLKHLFWVFGLLTTSLSACVPATALPVRTETATLSPTSTGTSSPTPVLTPTLTATQRTPPSLPVPYENDRLTPYGSPHTYIQDECQYLQDKWSAGNSPPGTVAMVIMFHSIGGETSGNQISEAGFHALMQALMDNGFQTITTSQLADFLENNASIPSRSVVLILDDRRPGTVSLDFMPYLNDNNWTLTLAWPIGAGDASTDKKPASNVLPGENFRSLWEQMEAYHATGRLDVQAHGVVHNIGMGPDATEKFITRELQGSMDAIQLHFNKVPIAIIWPLGEFSPLSAAIARQLGYRLGFTVNPRGPVMFNWIPLADAWDVDRTTWIPEGPLHDPLMLLPRFWDTDAIIHIGEVIQAGEEARAFASQNKAVELEYYDLVCASRYGHLP